jgi:hypothetical protein
MSIAYLFKNRFFLPFKPADGIKKAKIPLYKVSVLNAGSGPEKQILIKRLTDEKDSFVSYFQMEKVFLNSADVESFYAPLGFQCQKYDKYVLISRDDPFILAN